MCSDLCWYSGISLWHVLCLRDGKIVEAGMIASFKRGIQHDVSLAAHRSGLEQQTVRVCHSNAWKVGRDIFRCQRLRVENGMAIGDAMSIPVLNDLALKYGCRKELVNYAVRQSMLHMISWQHGSRGI